VTRQAYLSTIARAGILGVCTAALACAPVEGTFDEVAYNPRGLEFAVADRHTILRIDGQNIASRRPEGQISLSVFFSATRGANPNDAWRRYNANALSDIRRQLATRDGLLLTGISAERAATFMPLSATLEGGEQRGDFDFYVAAGDALEQSQRGLGDTIEVTVSFTRADDRVDGRIEGEVFIDRRAGDDQPADVNTGTVSFPFSLPLSPERLTKQNLAIAAPVLRCAAQNGPSRSSACVSVDEDPTEDIFDF